VPPGPTPPVAGAGGIAGLSASNRGCIRRASQLQLTGRRMQAFSVSVDGRRISARTLRILQRRATPLTRVFAPGRYLLTVRVSFQPGSATAPVALSRVVTVCGPTTRAPRVTG
jgi:hypothetical protein